MRPIGKYKFNPQLHLDQFLTDICCNHCIIQCFIGDNPKRAHARYSKSHSGYFPCEYCEAMGKLLHDEDATLKMKKAALIKQKEKATYRLSIARANNDYTEVHSLTSVLSSINEAIKSMNRKNNNIIWPSSTQNGNERTAEKILEISDKISEGQVLSIEESKGIKGRSLFLDIPYFDIVLDFPVEYLHCVCLGVGKRMIILTFNVGDNRQRATKRKLSNVEQFNQLMSCVLVVREFSRRARNLDLAVMKGQEYRNIILFYFELVVICIEPEAKERRLWLLLAYMIRACVIPNDEYKNIDNAVIEYCGKQFYKLYEQLFHARNCSYNTHTLASHLPKMRVHGPLTKTSAFGFESFYGEIRNSFTPGTRSPLKQIFEKILIKRSLSTHCCKPPIYFSPKDTNTECNSYIYTFNENMYNFFKITSISEDQSMTCFKVGKYETSFPETPTLDWSKVGVFKAGGISDEVVQIQRQNVSGKVIRVNNLFITCPNNVLEEK